MALRGFKGGNGRRSRIVGAACLGVLLAGILLLVVPTKGRAWTEARVPSAQPSAQASSPAPEGVRRLREGTELIDQAGRFEIAGDRIVFVISPGDARLVALENLTLERVARTMANNPGRMIWKINGSVTEYRGANFVLVHRAVLRRTGGREDTGGD